MAVADRGSRSGSLPQRIRRRHLRRSRLARPRDSMATRRPVAAVRRSCRCIVEAEGATGWSIRAFARGRTSPRRSTAPHGKEGSAYPGTCRALPDDPLRRATTPHSWRLDHAKAIAEVGLPAWQEADGIGRQSCAADFDDVILARKDAPSSYHLACVVDDAASGVDLVVRGADLRSVNPGAALASALARPAGTDLLPSPARHRTTTVAVWPSATLHRHSWRCAKTASMGGRLADRLRHGELPLGFRLSPP